MGFIQTIMDWSAVKREKKELLERFRQVPPGRSLSIKNPDRPITARALIELLQEHPSELELLDFGFEVTIMRKVSMAKTMSSDTYDHLHRNFGILDANGVAALGLNKGHTLPHHQYRNGVPDDINDAPQAVNDGVKTIITGDK